MMIARMWRGWVRTERLAECIDIVEHTGLAEYRQTPGNAGAQLLTRDLGDGRTERRGPVESNDDNQDHQPTRRELRS